MGSRNTSEYYNTTCHVLDPDTVIVQGSRFVRERTCVPEFEYRGDLILTRYPCCGYELKEYRYSPYPEVAINNCPNCGAKVVGE